MSAYGYFSIKSVQRESNAIPVVKDVDFDGNATKTLHVIIPACGYLHAIEMTGQAHG
jgi:hypothetical protein